MFNSLYENKKQIIMTSDLFPQEIPDIEERLRNRFQWSLSQIFNLLTPNTESAILKSKAKQLKINLTDDVAEYIADRAKKIFENSSALHRFLLFQPYKGAQ